MSSYNYANIHQDEDVIYDDLVQLNAELFNSGAGELLEDIEAIQVSKNAKNWRDNYIPYDGRQIDFLIQENGKTKIASVDDGHSFCGHVTENSLVWGCFYKDEMKIIAKHMTAGKLVIRMEIEGWPDEFYVLTPGSVKEVKATF